MYSIYADGELVYAPNMVRSGYQVLAPKLKQQLGKADGLTFQLPPGCQGYDRIKQLTTSVTLYDDDAPIFHGRSITPERNFQNIKTIKCEGARAFLNDTILRPYTFDDDTTSGTQNFWKMLFDNHNLYASSNRQITAGAYGRFTRCHRSSEKHTTTLKAMEDFLEDANILFMRYTADEYHNVTVSAARRIVWPVTGQVIRFGQNLLDFNEVVDAKDVYTCIIPIGKDGLTIKSVNNGVDYLWSTDGVNAWGKIYKVVQFPDITTASALMTAGREALADAIAAAMTVKIRAFDLKRAGLSTTGLELGTYHPVYSPPHGINTSYQLTRIETDMVNPERSIYEFGVARKTLTEQIL